MLPLWHLFVEMTVCQDDVPSTSTVGFMNVLLRGESATAAEQELNSYFASYGWSIVELEEACIIGPDFIADDDEFADLIERANAHPDPIMLGTFHSYKPN